ncbi:unnamed protein product [Caenorhabditis angaria]|uniref:F-box domain-containing protein n=1 Tax=Caenorhabditis angaria TaxID=860376 RepID=A0A9P1I6K8_9PELO|nr:unnamed protein product [Caenorhabditis angaria]
MEFPSKIYLILPLPELLTSREDDYEPDKLGWLDLPWDIREKIYKILDDKGLGKMINSSKTCQEEVIKFVKNYITSIRFIQKSEAKFELRVGLFGADCEKNVDICDLSAEIPKSEHPVSEETTEFFEFSKHVSAIFKNHQDGITSACYRRSFREGAYKFYPGMNVKSLAISNFFRWFDQSKETLKSLRIELLNEFSINFLEHTKLEKIRIAGSFDISSISISTEQMRNQFKEFHIVNPKSGIRELLEYDFDVLIFDLNHWKIEDYQRLVKAWIKSEIDQNFNERRCDLSKENMQYFYINRYVIFENVDVDIYGESEYDKVYRVDDPYGWSWLEFRMEVDEDLDESIIWISTRKTIRRVSLLKNGENWMGRFTNRNEN